MAKFKTLQFANNRRGQAAKIRALEKETAQGWRIVSETIVQGKFKGGNACCLFFICAPFAFLAGHTDGVITVTLERVTDRGTRQSNEQSSGRLGLNPTSTTTTSSSSATFDHAKWNALLKYDQDIADAAEKVRPFGSKWMDELASSFMALSDKKYLPEIVNKIAARAGAEKEELIARDKAEREEIGRQRAREEERDKKSVAWALGRAAWYVTRQKKVLWFLFGVLLLLLLYFSR